jgi:Fe-S-cluster containining protein
MTKSMIQIRDTILSDDIFEEHFICNLTKCKGACCVEGDSGAPLERKEFEQIQSILPEIWDDLSPAAKALIEEQGIAYTDYDGELVTSIINGRECVFTYFDADGTCKCSIERAWREGRIRVQKPVSCHLYPIRLQKLGEYTALNYNRWSICKPAVKLGRSEGVKIYEFLREPLIRRFGEEWYNEVCEAAKLLEEEKNATCGEP